MLGITNAKISSAGAGKDLTISLNGSSSIVYDGTTSKSLNITAASIGAAAASHNHDSVYARLGHNHDSIAHSGTTTAVTGSAVLPVSGISLVLAYVNGYPGSYGNVLRLKGAGCSELMCGWSGTSGAYASMFYRSQRDSEPKWSDWVTVLDSYNFSNYAARSSHTHPKSQITDFPTSLPANGGNADMVDGLHADSFVRKTITAATDLNTVVDSGFYRLNSGHTNHCALDWSQMIVCHGGSDTVAQIAVSYADSIIKFRGGNPSNVNGSGSWRPWAEVIDRTRFNPTKIQSGAPVSDALWAW